MPTHGRRRRIAGIVAGIAVGLLLVGTLYAVSTIADLTKEVRVAQTRNTETINLIRSCTTVGGKCYDDQERRTGSLIDVVNSFTANAIACADRPGTQSVARIRACALRKAQQR